MSSGDSSKYGNHLDEINLKLKTILDSLKDCQSESNEWDSDPTCLMGQLETLIDMIPGSLFLPLELLQDFSDDISEETSITSPDLNLHSYNGYDKGGLHENKMTCEDLGTLQSSDILFHVSQDRKREFSDGDAYDSSDRPKFHSKVDNLFLNVDCPSKPRLTKDNVTLLWQQDDMDSVCDDVDGSVSLQRINQSKVSMEKPPMYIINWPSNVKQGGVSRRGPNIMIRPELRSSGQLSIIVSAESVENSVISVPNGVVKEPRLSGGAKTVNREGGHPTHNKSVLCRLISSTTGLDSGNSARPPQNMAAQAKDRDIESMGRLIELAESEAPSETFTDYSDLFNQGPNNVRTLFNYNSQSAESRLTWTSESVQKDRNVKCLFFPSLKSSLISTDCGSNQ